MKNFECIHHCRNCNKYYNLMIFSNHEPELGDESYKCGDCDEMMIITSVFINGRLIKKL